MEPSAKLAKVTILVVDDDATMRNLVKEALKALGFSNIIIASDGESAIRELQRTNIDIVFCDWIMGDMDGIEFTKHVRSKMGPPTRTVPIIMLTGKSERKDVEFARDAGITEYLTKPFTIQQLCSRITSIVERPRDFVVAPAYSGPDRRRKLEESPAEKRTTKPRRIKAT